MRRRESRIHRQILKPYLHPLSHILCLELGFLVVATIIYLHTIPIHPDTPGRCNLMLLHNHRQRWAQGIRKFYFNCSPYSILHNILSHHPRHRCNEEAGEQEGATYKNFSIHSWMMRHSSEDKPPPAPSPSRIVFIVLLVVYLRKNAYEVYTLYIYITLHRGRERSMDGVNCDVWKTDGKDPIKPSKHR